VTRRPLVAAAKAGLGRAAASPGVERLTRRAVAGTANVLYYHYVGPPTPIYAAFDQGVDAARLDRDLALLARWFHFVPLADVVEGTATTSGDGRAPLAVTFDDGFDMASGPVPRILARHGVRATVFVITACLDNRALMWRNALSAIRALTLRATVRDAYADLAAQHGLPAPEPGDDLLALSRAWPMAAKDALARELWWRCDLPPLERFLAAHRPYFTWAGLRRWRAAGHEVGLHTHTHPFCARLSPAEVEAEVVAPAALLRRELGLDRVALSYPFGSRLADEQAERLVRDGTISCALGIEGFAPAGVAPWRLGRGTGEQALRWWALGQPLARTLGASRAAA
jgi:peptidoglycan/xylan/chitin deacetylase (PgdA/CDA1 family)